MSGLRRSCRRRWWRVRQWVDDVNWTHVLYRCACCGDEYEDCWSPR